MIPSLMKILCLLLLFAVSVGCSDIQPTLTPEEIEALIDERFAQELAKMQTDDGALSAQEIAEIALRSTVLLNIKRSNDKTSFGSGFFIDDYHVATNFHVVKGIVTGTVESVFAQTTYPIAAILAIDEEHDLAIVKTHGFTAPSLILANSDEVMTGDLVYVVGNPKGWKGTFSHGIVSARRPFGIEWVKGEVLQITAQTSAGSSGAPVLSAAGEVIGVHTGTDRDGEDLNFAIPVNHLKKLLAKIK